MNLIQTYPKTAVQVTSPKSRKPTVEKLFKRHIYRTKAIFGQDHSEIIYHLQGIASFCW